MESVSEVKPRRVYEGFCQPIIGWNYFAVIVGLEN
jgi:hypothetical protein